MKVLLVHPEDKFDGPWMREQWDTVVDLGRAPKSLYDELTSAFGCEVFSIYDLAREFEDSHVWRDLMRQGLGRVVDGYGLDWWDIIGLLLQADMQDVRLATRLADKLSGCDELSVTRSSMQADAVQLRLGIALRALQSGTRQRIGQRVSRYQEALSNLSWEQLRQIAYDKYDPHYRWRRNFARPASPAADPVVLLPSAYSNVTKTAMRYARLLPERQFLLVLARESAAVSSALPNVRTVPLAAFARGKVDQGELQRLERCWTELERSLAGHPEFDLSVRLGIVRGGRRWLRWGIPVRDAWVRVLEMQPVNGCLSADDSNPYTRIPLLLANIRKIPAIACHHGALDCRMAFKVPAFSSYLAQGEMERHYLEDICGIDASRIQTGAAVSTGDQRNLWNSEAPWIVFFSEPYETDMWRAAGLYREVLPRLCIAAGKAGKKVLVKLHPFESVQQRRKLVRAVLESREQKLVTVSDAPMSNEILRQTWCAVTVESTVGFECAAAGIPAFLCGWLRHAYSGYALQYARFGVGRLLETAAQLEDIPGMVEDALPDAGVTNRLVQAISRDQISELLSQPVSPGLR